MRRLAAALFLAVAGCAAARPTVPDLSEWRTTLAAPEAAAAIARGDYRLLTMTTYGDLVPPVPYTPGLPGRYDGPAAAGDSAEYRYLGSLGSEGVATNDDALGRAKAAYAARYNRVIGDYLAAHPNVAMTDDAPQEAR